MITLSQLYKILENGPALSTEDGTLFHPSVSALTGGDDNEFACFCWEEDGVHYMVKFAEGPNRSVTVWSNAFILIDTEGDEHTFYVFSPVHIAPTDE